MVHVFLKNQRKQILIETFEEQGNDGNVPTHGLDGEDATGDEEDEEQGVPIDGENVVHDNALPGSYFCFLMNNQIAKV